MDISSNSSILKKLLWINIFILLSACQATNIINNIGANDAESDADPKFETRAIAPFNAITGKLTNLYTKGSLEDYIGDLDKKNLAIATQDAADTGQPQAFTNQDSGVQGKAEVIQSRTLSTQESGKKDGIRECKTVRRTIILKDKREVIESVILCKGTDGWS
jgi:hypothetical protein